MANLDPQVQIKLIEISKDWVTETTKASDGDTKRELYLKNFSDVYKRLVEAISGKQT